MNKLPFEKRRHILHMMVERGSIRGIARIADVSPVTRPASARIGRKCLRRVPRQSNVKAQRVQWDEIWSFVFAKDRNAKPEMKTAGTAGSA
ncbi:MAG TPA: hypothetical protein VHU23_19815 [Rhizomicrobium sp.]|jgi:hypothetical protein|nr:hypothetical protein [Rhizomicrobium sp.]